MIVRKFIASALATLALFAWAPSPAPAAAPEPQADRVYTLAGTYSCRSADGATARVTGVRAGDTLKVHEDVVDRTGQRTSYDDRYTFDPARQRWHVVSGFGNFSADLPPWTAASWTAEGNDVNTVARRMTLELLSNGDFRRSFFYGDGRGTYVIDTVERCAPGLTPPATDACIAERYPATTLQAPLAESRGIPRSAYPGKVQLAISLNERSEVVGVRVLSSTNEVLNASALAAARAGTFRTEIRNCRPLAADYVFTVIFGADETN